MLLSRFRQFSTGHGPLHIGNLKPAAGSHKRVKRRGRGIASGGRTCGKGNAGQSSRSGPDMPRGFEGGQTPIYLRMPKVGQANPNRREYCELGLGRIQFLIDTGRLDPKRPIDIGTLFRAGITDLKDGVKVLGGKPYLLRTPGLCIQATRFTQEAIRRIESLGGLAVSVWHNHRSLLTLRDPQRWPNPEAPGWHLHRVPPSLHDRLFYSSEKYRGYLNPRVKEHLLQRDPDFAQRYEFIEPVFEPERPPIPTVKNHLDSPPRSL